MRLTLLNGLIGSAVGLGLLAPAAAVAQHKGGGYHHYPKCDGGHTLPISDKHYIKKYCGPTVNAGACFGYYPTKWTQWEVACPEGVGCEMPVYGPAPVDVQVLPPTTGAPAANMPPSAPVEAAPTPKPAVPQPLPPTTPEKTNPAPAERPKTEANAAPRTNVPPAAGNVIHIRVPEVNVRYPGDAPVQPVLLPPTPGGS